MGFKQTKIITILTVILSISLALVSYSGAFLASTYQRDSMSVRIQGMGQDIVDLFIVVPLLIVSLLLFRRGNKFSFFILGGTIFYILYSFFIYCFGVHFNNLFLLYCLILGISLYAFIIILIQLNSMEVQNWFSGKTPLKTVAIYFIVIATMFYLLWLKDIIPAMLNNTVPDTVINNKLLVNPVHVLDIAITLPGFVLTAILLLKKHKLGFVLAPILLVFIIILALALIGMLVMLKVKGINDDISGSVIFGALLIASAILLIKYLNSVSFQIAVSLKLLRKRVSQHIFFRYLKKRNIEVKKNYIIYSILLFCILIYCNGCVSYSTLQSTKTLSPGKVIIGGGSSFPVADEGVVFEPELNARIGIIKDFDVGAKFSIPSLFFLDGKFQILDRPFAVSADLGWSYFSYSDDIDNSWGKSTGWYPMLIAGEDHWYIAFKEVYFITKGEFHYYGLNNKLEGAGWISTNITAGAIIGNNVRLIPELNLIVPRKGKSLFVPAIGLQFVL
jgi:hypothetical protein